MENVFDLKRTAFHYFILLFVSYKSVGKLIRIAKK